MHQEFEVPQGNPVIIMLAMMEQGNEFNVVEMEKCDRKWYYNADQ
jgi:hypothetical protein